MNVAKRLERAANLIERDGWFQMGEHGHYDGVASNCAASALLSGLSFSRMGDEKSFDVFAAFIGPVVEKPRRLAVIYRWNDAPGQTKENVIATMRACAAIWRAKQENTDASKAAGPEVSVRDS